MVPAQLRIAAGAVWIVASCLVASWVEAAQLNLRHYDTGDGIPQIQISSVHQDPAGYLWIGTYGGLARYNGNRFRVFRGESGLLASFITVVDSHLDGTVWAGTARGLCRYDGAEFRCFNPPGMEELMVTDIVIDSERVWVAANEGLFRFDDELLEPVEGWSDGPDIRAVNSLALDSDGRLWVAAQAGLFRLDESGPKRFDLSTSDTSVSALEWHEERLWAGALGRLFSLDSQGEEVEELPLPVPDGTEVSDIEFDSDGQLWIATPDGLVTGESERLQRLTTRDGLPDRRMFAVTEDREGLIWVATDQGLVKILPGPFDGYTADSGLLASFVRTINEDDRQNLWLGTREGLQIVPRLDGVWDFAAASTILREDGLPDSRVYHIAFGQSGTSWIATAQGVVRWQQGQGVTELIDRSNGLPGQEVHAVLIDRDERLWISTTKGTRYRKGTALQTPAHDVLAGAFAVRIREDRSGRLWFATLRDGLLVLHPDGSLDQYRKLDGLTDEILWDLAPSADGSMWVGSNGDGVFRVWPDGRIDRFTRADGLADDSVWQVLEDDQGRLWGYTNRGLSRMSGGEFANYTERDGLLHLEGGATGAFQSSDGLLWFASADGLMRYDADREYRNQLPPPVVVESAMLDSESVMAGARLPFRSGSLVLRYAGLSYQDETAVQFRYRLTGATSRWSEPTGTPRVTYANLGYGDYVFEVIAANPDGVWSPEPARFSFVVATPFWVRPWFLVLVFLALGGLVWLGVNLRLRHIEVTRRRLQELVRQRTAELREANRRQRRVARTDQLTGLPNRRYLFDRIGDDVAQSRRAHFDGTPSNSHVAFIMIDLDDFKRFNDEFGHDCGDLVLAKFSRVVSDQLRESDYMVRWGGEEFLVVACHAECDQAHQIAERIIQSVRSADMCFDDEGKRIAVTCSAGIACYPFGQPVDALDWESIAQLADIALYQAKAEGRDCWVHLLPGEELELESAADFVGEAKTQVEKMIEEGLLRRIRGA